MKEREGEKSVCERGRKRDIQRGREGGGQLSILRHDFSEDTAACCDYWGAAEKRRETRGENESERGHERGNTC